MSDAETERKEAEKAEARRRRQLRAAAAAEARYVLSGPGTLTQTEQAQAISDALGRTVRWEELSREAAGKEKVSGPPSPHGLHSMSKVEKAIPARSSNSKFVLIRLRNSCSR